MAANDWRAGTAARRAMGELVRTYWFPLYAYLRRRGNAPAQAEDLVQGFFARLLEKDALALVDRERGKCHHYKKLKTISRTRRPNHERDD